MNANKPSHPADYTLVEKARTDQCAAEQLLRRVYPKIFQISRFALGNRRQAEDIAQVAALEVMKSLKTYSGKGSVEAWAGQIPHRVAMRTVKKERETARMIPRMLTPLVDTELPRQ